MMHSDILFSPDSNVASGGGRLPPIQGVDQNLLQGMRENLENIEERERFDAVVGTRGELYQGDWRILRAFLVNMDTLNPFAAAQRAQVDVIRRDAVPDRYLSPGAGAEPVVTGVSGHHLSAEYIVHTYNPAASTSQGFFSGTQAIRKIMSTFGGASDNGELDVPHLDAIAEVPAHQERIERELSREPSEGRSLILRYRLEAAQALDQQIQELRERLSLLRLCEQSPLDAPRPLSKVKADSGGQLLGWFERTLQNGMLSIPEAIVEVYTLVRSKDTRSLLSADDLRYYLAGLEAYRRSQSHVNTHLVLPSRLVDLERYQQFLTSRDDLSPSEARRLQQIPSVVLSIRELLDGKDVEVSLSDISGVLLQFPFDEIREELNQETFERFRVDWTRALELFHPLFMENEKLREDCERSAPSQSRLKDTAFALALQQKDWAALREAFLLQELTHDSSRFLRAVESERFTNLVERVASAARKGVLIASRAEQLGVPLDSRVTNRDPFSDVLFPGSRYVTMERGEDLVGVTFREIAARARCQFGSASSAVPEEVSRALEVGLFDTRTQKKLERLIAGLSVLIPAQDVFEDLEMARTVARHPLVLSFPYQRSLEEEFVSVDMLKSIRASVKAASDLAQFDSLPAADQKTIREALPVLLRTPDGRERVFFWGGRDSDWGTATSARLKVEGGEIENETRVRSAATFAELSHCGQWKYGVHLLSAQGLVEKVVEFRDQYVAANSLGKEWLSAFRALTTKDSERILSGTPVWFSDGQSWRRAHKLFNVDTAMVSRALVEAVRDLAERAKIVRSDS